MMSYGRVVVAACLLWMGAVSVGRATPAQDREAALQLLGRGTAAFDVGDVVGATRHWTEAIRLCRLAGAPTLEAEALAHRGEAYRVEGQFRQASEDLTAALERAKTANDATLIAATSGALGNLAFMSRRVAVAEPLLLDSNVRARQIGDQAIAGASGNDLGNLYAATTRPQQAAQAYADAIQAADAAGDQALAATAETNAARLALDRNDPGRAAALLTSAMGRLSKMDANYPVALGLIGVGLAGTSMDNKPMTDALATVARHSFERARDIGARLGNDAIGALALGGLGHMDERAGQFERAAQSTQGALFMAQKASAPNALFRLEWQQARIDRALGREEAAFSDYRRAVTTLESVRRDIPEDYREGRSSFQATFGAVYLQLADMLLRRAHRDPPHAQALITEARDTIEASKQAELQDYFRDSCIADFEAKQRGIEIVAPETAIIYPIILPDRTELLVSVGTELHDIVVPITEPGLRTMVGQYRQLLEKRSTNEYLVPARTLYDLLMRPVDALLSGRDVQTIVVVPDGVLRTMPFGALYDGKGFLIERYAFATVPGLRLVDPRPLGTETSHTLAVGLSESRQGFSALPDVATELDDVHKLEGGTILLDDAFLRSRFERTLMNEDFSIVHIASHGQFGTDPSESFVLAYDGRLTLDDLENSIKLTRFRDPGLELLVLSACQTAAGDDRAALGLAGLALKAGARSALATLWSVSDQASGPLTLRFYERLQKGASKAQALRQAQRNMIRDPLLGHPAYWAPFLLIGNWL